MLAALLLAAAAPAPDTALLDAFRTACSRVDDFAGARADIAGAGWAEVGDDADPRVAKLAAVGKQATGEDGKLQGAVFRRTIGGRAVYLFLSRFEDADSWGNGCRLFDFDAPAPIAPKVADGWMGRIPTGTDGDNGVARRLWLPGWREGVSVEVNYVPAGSAIAEASGLQGVVLVAQAFGGN
jgi:hypothetical protein